MNAHHEEYQAEQRVDGQWWYTQRIPCTCAIGENHWTVPTLGVLTP